MVKLQANVESNFFGFDVCFGHVPFQDTPNLAGLYLADSSFRVYRLIYRQNLRSIERKKHGSRLARRSC